MYHDLLSIDCSRRLTLPFQLTINSSYGKLGLNKHKMRNVTYRSKESLLKKSSKSNPEAVRELKKTGQKIQEDCFTTSFDEVIGEYPSGYFEIISKKRSFTDDTAVHFSHAILQNAKLHMLKFITMAIKYWQTDCVR